MSTRCTVVVTDMFANELYFYRHSDGYPEGVKQTLLKFMGNVRNGVYRDNASQAAGWLVILGYEEYAEHRNHAGYGWKVGAYEPDVGVAGDSEYLYVIDLSTKKCHVGLNPATFDNWDFLYREWPELTEDFVESEV